jgi:ribosomal protein L7/L12
VSFSLPYCIGLSEVFQAIHRAIFVPNEYACRDCALTFTLGWFHYHASEAGYGSQSMLVCKACGTQHAIEIAEPVRPFSSRERYNVEITSVPKEDQLLAMRVIREVLNCNSIEAKARLDRLPCILAIDVDSYDAQKLSRLTSSSGIEISVAYFHPRPAIVIDRLLSATKPWRAKGETALEEVPLVMPLIGDHSIDLPIQKCRACNATDSITGELEKADLCPSCKKPSLEITSYWIA